jgi:hypothetical protein
MSGAVEDVKEIRARLRAEGYTMVDQYIDGQSLLKTLKQHCEQAVSVPAATSVGACAATRAEALVRASSA